MKRRNYLKLTGGIVGLGLLGTVPVGATEHHSTPPEATNDRGNWIRGHSEPVTVYSVEEKTSDPSASNFDEEFTYWKVTFEPQTFDTWVYREPARLGGSNYVLEDLGGWTWDDFWYGVTAPDDDGIQHEIVHEGQAIQYFETESGWMELTAKFDDGQLLEVNGVEPE